MEFKRRKQLRLKNYDYKNNGAYFITICTVGKRHTLGKIVGGDAYIAPHIELSEYGVTVEKYVKNIKGLDTYTIMPNHIHMIIRIGFDSDGTMWAWRRSRQPDWGDTFAEGVCAPPTRIVLNIFFLSLVQTVTKYAPFAL